MPAAALGDKRLRIAFAGAGAISPFHLTGWKQTPNVEVAAICDPVLDKARTRAAEFDVLKVYADFTEMLERETPDAVDIATPVGTHAALARIAADRGVHVMLQKPMTPTVAEAVDLVTDVGERVRFMVHENYRFRPHYVDVKRWLDEGRIGMVLHARMQVRCSGMAPVGEPILLKRQPYLKDFRRLLIFEVLIHHLDVLRVFLGLLTVMHAQTARINPALAGEDVAVIAMRGDDDITCVLDGNISAAGHPPLPVDRLEIVGSKGTLIYDVNRLYLAGGEDEALQYDLQKTYQT
jgi:predicted dehydrogenase